MIIDVSAALCKSEWIFLKTFTCLVKLSENLKGPRILILDEALISLDSESESLIQDAMKRVMVGRMPMVITHCLYMILVTDLILKK